MNRYFIFFIFLSLSVFAPAYSLAAYTEKPDCSRVLHSSHPSGDRWDFLKGYCHYDRRDYRNAIEKLSGLENRLPVLADYIIFFRASSHHKLNERQKALSEYRRVAREHKSSTLYNDALLGKAEIYAQTAEHDNAIAIYMELAENLDSHWLKARYKISAAELYERQGDKLRAMELYTDVWVNHPHTPRADSVVEFSSRNGLVFNPSARERKMRADNLYASSLWERALSEYRAVPTSIDTRINEALCLWRMNRTSDALEILGNVDTPEAHYHSGKITEHTGMTGRALEIYGSVYKNHPESRYAPDALMRSAEILRLAGYDRDAASHYRIIIDKYPESVHVTDAAWYKGWIHYRSGEFEKALEYFSSYSYPENSFDSQSFEYWKGKSLQRLGRNREALEVYTSISESRKYTYHAFLARLITGHKPRERKVLTSDNAFTGNSRRQKVEILLELGLTEYVSRETEALRNEARTADDAIYVSSLYHRAGNYYASVTSIENYRNPSVLFYSFPKPYSDVVEKYSKKYGIDELLIYSLIREESRFDSKAVSRSDARGLMQLLPSTARDIAPRMGIAYTGKEMLFDPEVNVDMGTFYLRRILNRFNGEIPIALAAYNAGQNWMAELLLNTDYKSFDEFVEDIPDEQPRKYVKRILRSYGAYRALYGYPQ